MIVPSGGTGLKDERCPQFASPNFEGNCHKSAPPLPSFAGRWRDPWPCHPFPDWSLIVHRSQGDEHDPRSRNPDPRLRPFLIRTRRLRLCRSTSRSGPACISMGPSLISLGILSVALLPSAGSTSTLARLPPACRFLAMQIFCRFSQIVSPSTTQAIRETAAHFGIGGLPRICCRSSNLDVN